MDSGSLLGSQRNIVKIIIMAIVLLTSSASFADHPLSSASINALLGDMTRAAKAKNIQQYMNLIGSSLAVTLEYPEESGGKYFLDKRGYQKSIENTWRLPATYEYDILNTNIIIIGAGERAIVTTTENERLSLNGEQLFVIKTSKRFMIVSHHGKPEITEIYAVVKQEK